MSISKDFKIGDVVELRSGSQLMTIANIDVDENTATVIFWVDSCLTRVTDVPLVVLMAAKA